MSSTFLTFYHLYGRVLTALAFLAGLTLFGLMWLVDLNALSRKMLNQPINGTLEITEALMPLVILLPMAFTQYRRGHIRVALLTNYLSPSAKRIFYIASLVIGCAFFAWAAWATGSFAWRSFRIGETAWGAIRFEIWPSKAAISLGAALLSFQFLLDVIKAVLFPQEDEDEFPEASPEEEAVRHG